MNGLRLEVLVEPTVGGDHQLIILIDGEDVLPRGWAGKGRDPDDLLGDASPLLPTGQGRQVALLRCGCGSEECGALVARIRPEGDRVVVWDDFRETSEFKPGGRKIKVGPFRFRTDEYVREVVRAHREREWESDDRRTARLVRERMGRERPRLAAAGWWFDFAGAGVTVGLPGGGATAGPGAFVGLRSGGRRVTVDFPDDGSGVGPEARAERIVETLVHGDPAEWVVSLKGGRLDEWDTAEQDELGRGGGPTPFRG